MNHVKNRLVNNSIKLVMKPPFFFSCRISIIFLSLITVLASCKHEADVPPIIPGTNDSICFETEVLPIFQSNCAMSGCHDGSREFALNNYADIRKKVEPGKANKSDIYKAITRVQWMEGFMPPSPAQPLSNAQITTIQLWILEGAHHTVCSDADCDSVNVTFSGTIQPVIELYCKGCHSGSAPSAGLSLTTYAQIKEAVDNRQLANHINQAGGYSVMPPSGQLSKCKLAQFNKWISYGTPNN